MKKFDLRNLSPLLGLVLFGVAVGVLHHALRDYHLPSILHHLSEISPRSKGLAIVLTALSYLVMTGYDRLAIVYIDSPLGWGRVTFASFVSYAFSNSIGLSVLTSGSVRYRLYSSWDLSAEQIAKVVVFTTVTFWLGIVAVSGVTFLARPMVLPEVLHLPFHDLRLFGLLFLLVVAAYLVACLLHLPPLRVRGWIFPLPSAPLAVGQLLIGALDWALAGAVLYVLLPPGSGASFPEFLAIFLVAQTVALVSHVPGGLGVFESIIIVLVPKLPPSALLGSLLVYRFIYYLVPLAVAALFLGGNEVLGRREGVRRTARLVGRWLSAVVPQVLAVTTLIGGAVLLFSGATPEAPRRLEWLRDILPLSVVEISHFLGSIAGVGLLFLARGIQRRLDAAYHLTVLLLGAGMVLSLLKGVDYESAGLLAVMLVALLPCRRHFYRKASLFSQRFTVGWVLTIALILACTVWLGLFSYKHVEYSNELWWHFAWRGDAPRFLRATVSASVVTLFLAIAALLRPGRRRPAPPTAAEIERARAILAASGTTTAYLALLGDKYLFFNEAGTAFVMYGIEGRSWVAMGPPVGPPAERRELAWSFVELCERYGGWPVFYEVGREALDVCIEQGLSLLKLGEEARVPLAAFSLEGGERRGLRYITNRLDRDGYSFEVLPAEAVSALLPELKAVSDAWLGQKGRREKGFSLGFFRPEYLKLCPLALIRHEERIVAFANLWPGGGHAELSLDLMRYRPDAPSGVMDYLFTRLILWGKEQGYAWFNLGMAPLAGLENRPLAPVWNRLGALLFTHGEHFYNFQGLRDYKEKFSPVWEPRYLASPGGVVLPVILSNLTALISGGLKGVLGK